jgi:hypothetical protein
MITITANGDTLINGISPGRQFTLAASGTFASGVITAKYCTGLPVAATLALDDDQSDAAIVLTATNAGLGGNSITIALVDPAESNGVLSLAQTDLDFVVSLATDAGDAATCAIGTGTNGVVTITSDTAGTNGNLYDVSVIAGAGASKAMSAYISGANTRPRIVVSLGTNAGGTADNAKNTATLIAAAIDALTGFSATASGTGADPVATQAAEAFTGGGDNASVTTTVGELLTFLQTNPLTNVHFTASLAQDADDEALIEPLAETALASGTAGTFAGFTTAISFSAAGDKTARNCGISSTIMLSAASTTGSTSINIIPTEIVE